MHNLRSNYYGQLISRHSHIPSTFWSPIKGNNILNNVLFKKKPFKLGLQNMLPFPTTCKKISSTSHPSLSLQMCPMSKDNDKQALRCTLLSSPDLLTVLTKHEYSRAAMNDLHRQQAFRLSVSQFDFKTNAASIKSGLPSEGVEWFLISLVHRGHFQLMSTLSCHPQFHQVFARGKKKEGRSGTVLID